MNHREETERVVKRLTKAQIVDYLARVEKRADDAREEARRAQTAAAEVEEKGRRFAALEKAVAAVAKRRGEKDVAALLEEILDKSEDIARAIELEAEAFAEESEAAEDRERMLRALGMDEWEWGRVKWKF